MDRACRVLSRRRRPAGSEDLLHVGRTARTPTRSGTSTPRGSGAVAGRAWRPRDTTVGEQRQRRRQDAVRATGLHAHGRYETARVESGVHRGRDEAHRLAPTTEGGRILEHAAPTLPALCAKKSSLGGGSLNLEGEWRRRACASGPGRLNLRAKRTSVRLRAPLRRTRPGLSCCSPPRVAGDRRQNAAKRLHSQVSPNPATV